MTIDIKVPENIILQPVITVFGIGGAGGNAINNMIKAKLKGANFVVANTDAQALKYSESNNTIQLGALSTKGLGAGANPDIGKESAIENENEIRSHLEGSNMVFITAGMGGGTGTGASSVIANIAKELGILTVGVVTKPFLFEGAKRMKIAEEGLKELQKNVDTLIVIPNQNLFRVANENTTFQQAFEMADEVLHAGVREITNLITSPGLVNLDFADVKTVMLERGQAMMGTGESTGEDRAIKAAEAAIANPLLDQSSMHGACGVLINITGGKDMTLYEVDSAANRIREEVGDSDANIIFGSSFNPDLEGMIRVSVVATGIDQDKTIIQKEVEAEMIEDNIEIPPPLFNEYNPEIQNNDDEIQFNLNKLSEEVDVNKANINNSFENNVIQDSYPKPSIKKSLLRRLWDAFVSNDSNEETDFANKNDNFSNSPKESNLHKNPNIQEAPSFFKD